MWIKIKQAEKRRLCRYCNFAGRLSKEKKPCNYHKGESLNFRNVPEIDLCALRPQDIARIEQDYGVVNGKVKKKKV
jgi:hypothetical protein